MGGGHRGAAAHAFDWNGVLGADKLGRGAVWIGRFLSKARAGRKNTSWFKKAGGRLTRLQPWP